MSLVVDTGPAQEPVLLEDARSHLRVTGTSRDDEIRRRLAGARLQVEKDTGRRLINQTLIYRRDYAFPPTELVLPVSPVSSVTYVKYVDTDGVTQTMTVDEDYVVDMTGERCRIYPPYNEDWPSDVRDCRNAVEVKFVVGYGPNANDVPADLQDAVLLKLGDSWTVRAKRETARGEVELHAGVETYRNLISEYVIEDHAPDDPYETI